METNYYAEYKKEFLVILMRYLQEEKTALENKGLIPTLEEAINDVQEQLLLI